MVRLANYTDGRRLLTCRETGILVRGKVLKELFNGCAVVDFDGVDATQPFIDEVLGVIVLMHGKDVLRNITLKNCSDDVKSAIRFVVEDRLRQYEENGKLERD